MHSLPIAEPHGTKTTKKPKFILNLKDQEKIQVLTCDRLETFCKTFLNSHTDNIMEEKEKQKIISLKPNGSIATKIL